MTFPVPQFPLSGLQSISWNLALPLSPQGGRRQRRAARWAPQALPNASMAHMGGRDPTVTWMQGQVQKQRCEDLSFVHNPDESDSCKAEGRERERRERRKGRGKRGERRAGTGSTEGHTPCWESSQGYPGVLEQEAGAGVSPAPSLGERHKAASRNSWKVLPCPPHFKPQNILPVPASLLSPLGASPTASTEGGERGLGCWNYRINISASESKHLPGSRRQPGCQDPPAPGATGRGNRAQAAQGLRPQVLGGLQDSELQEGKS